MNVKKYYKKINTQVNDKFMFPLELDINSCREFPDDKTTDESIYLLKAIIVHRGNAHSGHYYTYIRDELNEGNWDLQTGEKYAEQPKLIEKKKSEEKQEANEEQKINSAKKEESSASKKGKKGGKKGNRKNSNKKQLKKEEPELNFDECDHPLEYNDKDLSTHWFEFNDTSVLPIPIGRLQKQFGNSNESAYMLVYKQKTMCENAKNMKISLPQYWHESIL